MPVQNIMIENYIKSGRLMLILHAGSFILALALASFYDTWLEALLIGGGTLGAITGIHYMAPGQVVSRIAMGAGLMVMTSLHIQQMHGMIEFHFGVFVFIALLLFYKDWVPVIAAAATIAVHHFLFYYLQGQNANIWVLPEANSGWWVICVHASYVVIETAIVLWMSYDLKKEYKASRELTLVTEQIVGGDTIDLTVKTSGASELLKHFDDYTAAVRDLVNQVAQNTNALHNTSKELVQVTEVVQEQFEVQYSQTNMIAAAVEEMTASSQEVTNNAKQAADTADNASNYANECKHSSEQTELSISQLEKEIVCASETIGSLDHETSQIGSLLDVIRGIAEQTNLLALNAAIEAARAGEQGRGFAVVADEVRSLAQRTQQSTQEIDQMIAGLQKGSSSAVKAIDSSQSLVGNSVENTHTNLKLMEQVSSSINDMNEMNQLIASSSNEQSTVTTEICANITAISESGSAVNEKIQNVKVVSSELEALASQLDKLNVQFKY